MAPRLRALRLANSLFALSPTCSATRWAVPSLVPAHQRSASILASLSDNPGAYHKKIRRGRGPASGKGKTAGRGQKGQHAHGKVPAGFEGGQTPLSITKVVRGREKYNPFKVEMSPVNLDRIQSWIDQGRLDPKKPITMKELNKSRCIHGVKRHGVKLLGRNAEALQSPIHIVVSRASASAIARIEALGGSVTTRFYSPMSIKQVLRGEAHPTISWQADEKLLSLFNTPDVKLQRLYSTLNRKIDKLKSTVAVKWHDPAAMDQKMQSLQNAVQAHLARKQERAGLFDAIEADINGYVNETLEAEQLEGEEREDRRIELVAEARINFAEQIQEAKQKPLPTKKPRRGPCVAKAQIAALETVPARLAALKLRDGLDFKAVAPYTTYKKTLDSAASAPEDASREAMKAVMQRLSITYPKALADATSRKDIEYYRDPAHRGYLAYKVKEGESPSLFFKPPGEVKDKKKQTARRQAAKASADNRLF